MRFARYLDDGLETCGVLIEDRLIPLDDGATLLDLIQEGGLPALHRAARNARSSPLLEVAAVALSDVRLLPPLDPPTIRDFSAFEEHVQGIVVGLGSGTVPSEWYEAPAFYFSNPHSLIGATDDVAIPAGCELFDFELEVAAVIGETLSSPSVEEATRAIVGYTILNDWSARDIQQHEMRVGLGPAKGKDFASTLGPWLVTADELEERADAEGRLKLEMSVSVNGKVVGHDTLSNMAWTFGELAAHAGRSTQLVPGDLIGSGTCGNGGCLAELWGRNGERVPPPLVPGDIVSMTVDGIGTISNRVVAAESAPRVPSARETPRATPR